MKPISKKEIHEGVSDDAPLTSEESQIFEQERNRSSKLMLKILIGLFFYLTASWLFVIYKYFRKAIHKRCMNRLRKELTECNKISNVVLRSKEIERINIKKNRLDRLLILDNLILRNKWLKILKLILKNRF